MLKIDLHTHTADDPVDFIPHTTPELIDRAAELGFGALAITLHDRQRVLHDIASYAADRGIVLIPGVERTLRGRHILLLNFPPAAASVRSFEDIARLKARHPQGLVVAPHPFFPVSNCLGRLMDRYPDLFDAVELNAFHTSTFDFNRKAIRWARAHGRPVVANSDAHRLSMLGASYSIVDAEPHPDAICSAIKAGRVQVHRTPLTVVEATTYFTRMMVRHVFTPRSALPLPATT